MRAQVNANSLTPEQVNMMGEFDDDIGTINFLYSNDSDQRLIGMTRVSLRLDKYGAVCSSSPPDFVAPPPTVPFPCPEIKSSAAPTVTSTPAVPTATPTPSVGGPGELPPSGGIPFSPFEASLLAAGVAGVGLSLRRLIHR